MNEPDNVQSAMLEILKRIQAEVSTVMADVSDVKSDVIGVKGRMDKLEAPSGNRDAIAPLC
jgi:hypothetical protein